MVSGDANLDTAIADSAHRLAEFADRCAATEAKADEITDKLRHRWRRRISAITPKPAAGTDNAEL